MLSSPSVKTVAPSSNLLRYLRCLFDYSRCRPKVSTSCRWSSNQACPGGLRSSLHLNSPKVAYGCSSYGTKCDISLVKPPIVTGTSISRRRSLSANRYQLLSTNGTRSFSTTTVRCRHFLRRLLGFSRPPANPHLKPDDLPQNITNFDDGNESNPFNVGCNLALKVSNEPRLRCTEFDGAGNVTLVNGEFKKSELIAKVSSREHQLNKRHNLNPSFLHCSMAFCLEI